MKRRFTLKYTAALLAATVLGFFGLISALLLCKRNAIWFGDELFQYVNYLLYYGRMFRQGVRSMLAGSGFDFPAYTLSNGYGMDTYVLLGSTFADPFNLVGLICPGKYVEYCYVGIILLRLIGCSFSFSYYCLRRGHTYESTLVASLCYTFSGALAFQSALRHPFFLTTAALFPLILAGIDKVFEDESPRLFVFAMALKVLSGTYFAYMVCLGMLGYCLINYFFGARRTHKRSVRDFFGLVLKFVFLLLLAFCIAAVILAPRIITILSQKRLGLKRLITDFYAISEYIYMPTGVLSISSANRSLYYGAVGTMLLVASLVCRKYITKRENSLYLTCIALIVASITLPYVGRMFNGFTYPTDRWMFIAAFCCSYIVCRIVPVLKQFRNQDWLKVVFLEMLFAAIGVIGFYLIDVPSGRVILGVAMLFAVTAGAIPIVRRYSDKVVSTYLSLSTLVTLTIVCALYYLPVVGTNYVTNYVRLGTTYNLFYKNSYAASMNTVKDEGYYRYSAAKVYGRVRNASLNLGNYAVDFYKSSYNQYVDDFRTELGLGDDPFNIRFFGSDERLAVEGLTGSRYFITAKKDSWRVPYDYTLEGVSKKNYQIWKSAHCLPVAFSTSRRITRTVYDQLTMAERQEALLQGCVLSGDFEEPDYGGLSTTSHTLDSSITPSNSVRLEDGRLTVLNAGSTITLEFNPEENAETYLQFLNLDYQPLSPSELAELKGVKLSGVKKLKTIRQDLRQTYPSLYLIKVSRDEGGKSTDICTRTHPQYGGKHNWLINAGRFAAGKTTLTLTFSHAGIYTFSDFSVVSQPIATIVNNLDSLSRNGATEFSFDGHEIVAEFQTREDVSYGVITVPYSKGWTALVDGKSAEVLNADTAFMAVRLEGAGTHKVVIRYITPGLQLGCVLSASGIIIGVILDVMMRRRKRKQEFTGGHFARA